MSDTFSKAKRREIMQAVRRERTAPEERLAALLVEAGYEFDRNVEDLPGKPDFVFPDADLAVFVHGCFWHGHSACPKGRKRPKSNRKYWQAKVERNQRRDQRVARQLREMGYSVYTVWECELNRGRIPTRLVNKLPE